MEQNVYCPECHVDHEVYVDGNGDWECPRTGNIHNIYDED